MSVKCLSAILGPEIAAPILWTPGKMHPLCRKSHVHKIPRFRGGGYFGFWGGGGSADFNFMGARIFLKKGKFRKGKRQRRRQRERGEGQHHEVEQRCARHARPRRKRRSLRLVGKAVTAGLC